MQMIEHLVKASGYSWQGFVAAAKHEIAFQWELVLCLVFIPLAFFIGHNAIEKILLIGSILLIVLVELINSAIEAAIDRISTEKHELSGRAKDLGSAAVLIALINAAVVWLFIGF